MDQTPEYGKKLKQQSNTYLKYSSLGFQLLATIGVAGWLGYLLDKELDMEFPAFMLGFGLLGFAGMTYQIYRSINK
jgi:F0F1-type ATP synthase assembly protein I